MAESLREILCFGRYEPLFRVAAGGMAEVYAARIQGEAGFQKLVAVKRMLPHLANDAGFVDMFLNEAKLAAHIVSPHVVQTMDLGRGSDGSLYIVMELVVGLSLARLVDGHPENVPIQIALELLAQASQGLDDAHEAETPAGDPLGLIHRDVSPHNILVGIDGRARVTDFGIARAINRPRPETNIRELKGKFAYMSPEQTRLKPLDRRSDVFSMGVVLWETLVGRRLFAHRDPMEAIRLVQGRPVPAPRELRPEIPEAVSNVVLQALERDRKSRFQTAGELALAIRRAARESYGEPPQRKEIAVFIEQSGGEELQRLQRLIRLGTDGAAPETIEAVQPGVTRVLAEDASGVAPIGTGARRTAVLDPEEDLIGPPTVLIASEPTPSDTGTAMMLSSAELPTGLFAADVPDPPHEDRTDIVRAPSGPPEARTTEQPLALDPPDRRPRAAGWGRTAWLALGAVAIALALGVAIAVMVFWPSAPESTVLPIAHPVAPAPLERAVTRVVAPLPPPAPDREVAPPHEASEPSRDRSELVAPEPERHEPSARTSPRNRHPRRRRPRPTPPPAREEPVEHARPSGAPLLGVQDLDRRPR